MAINAAPRAPQYIEGFNNTGSTIGAFLAVMGSPAAIALPSAVSSPVLGFTAEDIADQRRGDVQWQGIAIATAGEAISSADIVAGVRCYADTDGKVYKWDAAAGVNQAVCGMPLSTAAQSGDLIDFLIGAGGIGQGA